jgi:hydrogenase maturation protease
MSNNRKPILVLGIGNILLRDEGIGVHVINELQNMPLPENIEVVDGGTAGADLLDILAERQKIIIIDAIKSDSPPGTVLRFTLNDIENADKASMSMHDIGIPETLQMAKMIGVMPEEIVFFGITPENLSCGLEVSETLKRLIPAIIKLILEEIK